MARGNTNAQLSIFRPGKSQTVTAQAHPTPRTHVITATPVNRITVFCRAEGSTNVKKPLHCELSASVASQNNVMTGVRTPSAIHSEHRCKGFSVERNAEKR